MALNSIVNKLLKYVIMSLLMYSSVSFIPEQSVNTIDTLKITFVVSILFAIFDRILPSIHYNDDNNN
uniref:Uncharacterized protein n=1 Tax=viral metagenome TaxID=1070528 RepID=A0A6C0J5D1_9ZZZZ